MPLGNRTPEGAAFTALCDRADTDPDARREVERQIAERAAEIRERNAARKLAEWPRHKRYVVTNVDSL